MLRLLIYAEGMGGKGGFPFRTVMLGCARRLKALSRPVTRQGNLMTKSLLLAALMACVSTSALAQAQPWMDKARSPEARTQAAVDAMTLDEKLSLVMGYTDPDSLLKQPDSDV